MKKIRRPLSIGEVGTMLHLAEFFLTQTHDILGNIMIAPDRAVPDSIGGKASRMEHCVKQALWELENNANHRGEPDVAWPMSLGEEEKSELRQAIGDADPARIDVKILERVREKLGL